MVHAFIRRAMYRGAPFFKPANRAHVLWRLFRLRNMGMPIGRYDDLVKLFGSQTGVCHVFGSGWSATDGIDRVERGDAVTGMNFSGHLPVTFTVYSVELADSNPSNLHSRAQLELARELWDLDRVPILFKNVWETKNSLKAIADDYAPFATVLPDVAVWREVAGLTSQVKELLVIDATFAKQLASSVVLHIVAAVHAGNHTVVVHGVDFGGPAFYELKDFKSPRSASLPPAVNQVGVEIPGSQPHKTAIGPSALPAVLAELSAVLRRRQVQLLCGTPRAGSASVLPIYAP
jgi:hypothetical protein